MNDIALRTKLDIVYAGTNITREVSSDLLSFTYTDNEGGKSDDISITLKNDHRKWDGAWLPARGDKITAAIIQEGRGAGFNLPCGSFTVDEIEASGPPSVVTIKGISIPSESDIFRRKSSRAWENVRLSEIVQDIANTGQLVTRFLAAADPLFDRRDQRDETDMTFLKRLCDAESYAVKCTDEQLVIFSPEEQGKEPPVLTIIYGADRVKSWRFTAQNHDVYYKCTVEYMNPKDGKLKKYTFTQEGMTEGKTKKLVERAANLADAERRAKSALFEANRNEVTGSLALVGDTRLVAGATVNISGFGRFDGKYYIKTATHTVSSGYNTTIELSNTREEKGADPTVFNTPKTTGKRTDGLESILGE